MLIHRAQLMPPAARPAAGRRRLVLLGDPEQARGELQARQPTSLMPAALASMQTAATLAASAASLALGTKPQAWAHPQRRLAVATGLAAAAGSLQLVHMGLGIKRGTDSIVATASLALAAMALAGAGAVLVGDAQTTPHASIPKTAALLLGAAYLGHLAALGAQLRCHHDAFGRTPLPARLQGSPRLIPALGTLAALMALGGIASLSQSNWGQAPWPLAWGSALLGLSWAPAAAALAGAMHHGDWPASSGQR